MPELDQYGCFAADGRWHKGAVHDTKNSDCKEAVGHVYSLDLRTHTVRHFATLEGFHDHDTSMLQSAGLQTLMYGVKKGNRSHPHLRSRRDRF